MIANIRLSKKAARMVDSKTSEAIFEILAKGDYKGQRMPLMAQLEYRTLRFDGQQTKLLKIIAVRHDQILSAFLSHALDYYADSNSRLCEDWFQDALQKTIGGKREVPVPGIGRIDLLADKRIIELKYAKEWKHALGQVLAYQVYYPMFQPWLGLIGDRDLLVEHTCKSCGVEVMWLACKDGKLEITQ